MPLSEYLKKHGYSKDHSHSHVPSSSVQTQLLGSASSYDEVEDHSAVKSLVNSYQVKLLSFLTPQTYRDLDSSWKSIWSPDNL